MIEIELVMQAVKADDHEQELVAEYLAQAIGYCEAYCNRKFYADPATKQADFIEALNDLEVAINTRDTQLSVSKFEFGSAIIRDAFDSKHAEIKSRCHGVVIDSNLRAAIMKQTGYLFRRRQEGSEIPVEVGRILDAYVWPGDLAGNHCYGGS